MKNIPNSITAFRAVFSLGLLAVQPLSAPFFILYSLCGFSDILDGFLARRFSVESKLGSTLDSIADAIFFACVLWKLIPVISIAFWMMLWIAVIAIIRITSLNVHFFRFHKFAFLHTYANKLTGLMIFLFPVAYTILGMNTTIILICATATISAAEELLIAITAKELLLNIKGVFSK